MLSKWIWGKTKATIVHIWGKTKRGGWERAYWWWYLRCWYFVAKALISNWLLYHLLFIRSIIFILCSLALSRSLSLISLQFSSLRYVSLIVCSRENPMRCCFDLLGSFVDANIFNCISRSKAIFLVFNWRKLNVKNARGGGRRDEDVYIHTYSLKLLCTTSIHSFDG